MIFINKTEQVLVEKANRSLQQPTNEKQHPVQRLREVSTINLSTKLCVKSRHTFTQTCLCVFGLFIHGRNTIRLLTIHIIDNCTLVKLYLQYWWCTCGFLRSKYRILYYFLKVLSDINRNSNCWSLRNKRKLLEIFSVWFLHCMLLSVHSDSSNSTGKLH